ncbi:hypothetical protein BP6252_03019 [Coleophoma cylindrospora]|uniref:Heterokaryon incompatibility domain-containing protein n=1 Tax=Coleophoma cylindrospora TaxID=1849047 RepID=A0A3D8S6H0_9HELO|nr:hypothetical protein BP6252_03019 [Coleophoma cylindrospora]
MSARDAAIVLWRICLTHHPWSKLTRGAMEPYSYTPLDPSRKQFRLLILKYNAKAADGIIDSEPLSGRLKCYNIPATGLSTSSRVLRGLKLPAYQALSYVWGDAIRTKEIIIEGKRLLIAANLYDALTHLRLFTYSEVRVWADAICINQDDLSEKSSQILLMRQIYSLASEVSIWLGFGTKDSSKVISFINELTWGGARENDSETEDDSRTARALNSLGNNLLLRPVGKIYQGVMVLDQVVSLFEEMLDIAISDDSGGLVTDEEGSFSLEQEAILQLINWQPKPRHLKKVQGYDFQEMARLISKLLIDGPDWFERIWVIQEAGMALGIRIRHGKYDLSWLDFLYAVHYLHYSCNIHIPNIRKITSIELIRLAWGNHKRQALRDLVVECRYRHSSDPRDKIYALQGLMGDPLTPYLEPDYHKPISEVFSNTALHIITQDSSLNHICGQQAEKRRAGLPSWVPDYELDRSLCAASLVPLLGRKTVFNAAGRSYQQQYAFKDPVGLSGHWSILPTQGVCLDDIARVSISSDSDDTQELGKAAKNWQVLLTSAPEISQDLPLTTRALLDQVAQVVGIYSEFLVSSNETLLLEKLNRMSLSEASPLNPNLHGNDAPEKDATTLILHNARGADSVLNAYIATLVSGRVSSKERLDPAKHYSKIFYPSPPLPKRPQMESPPSSNSRIGKLKSFSVSSLNLSRSNSDPPNESSSSITTDNQNVPSQEPRSNLSSPKSSLSIKQIAQLFSAGITRRNLMVTGTGMIGASPQHARPGDKVCVLWGCDVPVVLRPITESLVRDGSMPSSSGPDKKMTYEFIGECYLHGYMDGEALSGVTDGLFEVQEFMLR